MRLIGKIRDKTALLLAEVDNTAPNCNEASGQACNMHAEIFCFTVGARAA